VTGATGTALAHPAQVGLALVDRGVEELAAANLWSMPDRDLLDLRLDQERTLARLQAQVLATTREIDARDAAKATGASSTEAWLRGRCLRHPGAAKAEVRLAKELDQQLPVLRSALAAGDVSLDHAQVIAGSMRRMPAAVDGLTRSAGEELLARFATEFDPHAIGRLGRHLVHVVDPEHGAALERDEAANELNEAFTMVSGADGAIRLNGQFTADHGALVAAGLDPLAKPRKGEDGTPDPRSAAKRRADALIDLIRLGLASADAPTSGGEPVTMTVTTTAEHVQSVSRDGTHGTSPVAAHLEDGTPLSPETTRRLGCDAWLQAAIVDSDGALLYLGRRTRVVNGPLRRALILRDHGCAFPGCGRPARWCHAHHIWHWSKGGPTDIDNLVLLCGHHHRVIHHDGWTVHIGDRQLPVFSPPRWVDPDQQPRPPWRPPHLMLS